MKSNGLSGALRQFFIIVSITLISSCGGPSDSDPAVQIEEPRSWWQTATPDLSPNENRPVITLIGDNTISLEVGAPYDELGALASDPHEGDLTAEINISTDLDTDIAGDYLVRYSVTNSSSISAIEAVRIVRVSQENLSSRQSLRVVGSSFSHLGYIEHLPASYSDNPDKKHPLIIFSHGNGANASLGSGDRESTLRLVIQQGGPPYLISQDLWHSDDSFIVLSPQVGDLTQDPYERLEVFIDYALATYNIDASRVYLSGWSQGANMVSVYALENPDKVAALVSISNGIDREQPLDANFCDIETVPVWLFHGQEDPLIPADASVAVADAINSNCAPFFAPRLTLFLQQPHSIHTQVFSLGFMQNGALMVDHHPSYDPYDVSIFDWLLSHSLDGRQ